MQITNEVAIGDRPVAMHYGLLIEDNLYAATTVTVVALDINYIKPILC